MGGSIEADFWEALGGKPVSINAAVPDSVEADEATMN